MLNYFRNTLIFLSVFLFACSSKDSGAQLRLDAARDAYTRKDYSGAKQEIDSIKILYPKSFEEIKAGLVLLDSVRKGENMQVILTCDSLIALNESLIAKTKSLFSYQRNKEYQEAGTYIPKENLSGAAVSETTLRSGVGADGVLYIESVFAGGKQKHNRIKVSAKDGSSAQSLSVAGDGVNYRFSTMGKDYEILRFAGRDENGVAQFIRSNVNKPLTVTLEGQGKYSYNLSQTIKTSISKSSQLSTLMLQLDSLKTAKDKALHRNYYLDNEKGKKSEDLIK